MIKSDNKEYMQIIPRWRESALVPGESVVALCQLFINHGNVKFPMVEIPSKPVNEAFIFSVIGISQDL